MTWDRRTWDRRTWARRTCRTWARWGLVAMVLWAPGASARADVRLSSDLLQRLGVRTALLAAARHQDQVDAFAKVLDPGPLAALDADLRTARTASAASAAEARRLRAVRTSVQGAAAKDVEAADSQAAQDRVRLALLRRRLGLEWGPGIARLGDAARARLIAGLAAGRLALVHIDTASNEGQDGARSAEIDVGTQSAHAVILGPARAAEPRLQSSGLIGLVSGPLAIRLSNGLTQSAHITRPGGASGVWVPKSAVVRDSGADWVYVRTAPAAFARRRLQDPTPGPDGLFVERGLSPGQEVVVAGVGALLTAESAQPASAGP